MEQDTVGVEDPEGPRPPQPLRLCLYCLYFVVRGLVFIHQDYEGRKGGKSFTSCN